MGTRGVRTAIRQSSLPANVTDFAKGVEGRSLLKLAYGIGTGLRVIEEMVTRVMGRLFWGYW